MRGRLWEWALIWLLLMGGTWVWGAQVEESRLDAQVREIAKTLRCAVCQNESVWDSRAGLAREMREIIREKLQAGETPEEIRAYFLSRYGDYILLEPRKQGINWLLWTGPFVILFLGGGLLFWSLRRWKQETPPESPLSLDPQQREKVERFLASLEEKD